jgi:hypothetical protein
MVEKQKHFKGAEQWISFGFGIKVAASCWTPLVDGLQAVTVVGVTG